MTYRIHWSTNHACGELAGEYDKYATAERAARAWKREMVAIDEHPRLARAEYQWEVVFVGGDND